MSRGLLGGRSMHPADINQRVGNFYGIHYSICSILVSQGWRRLDLWTESQLNLLLSLAVQLPPRAKFVHTSGCQKSHLTILESSQCACAFQLNYLTAVFHFIQSSINSLNPGFLECLIIYVLQSICIATTDISVYTSSFHRTHSCSYHIL